MDWRAAPRYPADRSELIIIELKRPRDRKRRLSRWLKQRNEEETRTFMSCGGKNRWGSKTTTLTASRQVKGLRRRRLLDV